MSEKASKKLQKIQDDVKSLTETKMTKFSPVNLKVLKFSFVGTLVFLIVFRPAFLYHSKDPLEKPTFSYGLFLLYSLLLPILITGGVYAYETYGK